METEKFIFHFHLATYWAQYFLTRISKEARVSLFLLQKCVKKQLGKDISSVSISTAILLY